LAADDDTASSGCFFKMASRKEILFEAHGDEEAGVPLVPEGTMTTLEEARLERSPLSIMTADDASSSLDDDDTSSSDCSNTYCLKSGEDWQCFKMRGLIFFMAGLSSVVLSSGSTMRTVGVVVVGVVVGSGKSSQSLSTT